jgi:hypothetical protein
MRSSIGLRFGKYFVDIQNACTHGQFAPQFSLFIAHPVTVRIQDTFWTEDYAQDHARKISSFNHELGKEGWSHMLAKTCLNDKTFLEVGCNI